MDSPEKNITSAAEVLASSIEVLANAVLFAAFKAAKGPGATARTKRRGSTLFLASSNSSA
jgi:hypothetical protein